MLDFKSAIQSKIAAGIPADVALTETTEVYRKLDEERAQDQRDALLAFRRRSRRRLLWLSAGAGVVIGLIVFAILVTLGA